jgi:hypothetical protein
LDDGQEWFKKAMAIDEHAYTLLGSFRRHSINPFNYLKDLFTRLPAAKITHFPGTALCCHSISKKRGLTESSSCEQLATRVKDLKSTNRNSATSPEKPEGSLAIDSFAIAASRFPSCSQK